MGAKTTYYRPAVLYPVDNASPAEWEGEITSDLTGEEITDWDNIWETPDGDICSFEEACDMFIDSYTSDVSDDEYEEALDYLINKLGYSIEDVENHPKLIKIDLDNEIVFEISDLYSVEDYLEEAGFITRSWEDLDWDSDADDYEPDCDY